MNLNKNPFIIEYILTYIFNDSQEKNLSHLY